MVVDASVLVDVVRAPAGSSLRAILAEQPALHSPCLLDAEFVRGLRHLEQRRELTSADALIGLHYLRALPIQRHDVGTLTPRMWQLRHNLGTYDAAYVALAEMLAVPLLTADAHIAGAPGLRCQVVVA